MKRINQAEVQNSDKSYIIKSIKFSFLIFKEEVKIAVVVGIVPSLTLIGFFIMSLDNTIWEAALASSNQQENKFYIVFMLIAFFGASGLTFLLNHNVFQSLESYDSKWKCCTRDEKMGAILQTFFPIMIFIILTISSKAGNSNLACILFSFFINFIYIFYVV